MLHLSLSSHFTCRCTVRLPHLLGRAPALQPPLTHPNPTITILVAPPPTPPPAGVLWSISPSLVVFLFAYALLGTAATTGLFGRVLTVLYFKLLSQEGDLRFSLVRVREHAESIAFYRGGSVEMAPGVWRWGGRSTYRGQDWACACGRERAWVQPREGAGARRDHCLLQRCMCRRGAAGLGMCLWQQGNLKLISWD